MSYSTHFLKPRNVHYQRMRLQLMDKIVRWLDKHHVFDHAECGLEIGVGQGEMYRKLKGRVRRMYGADADAEPLRTLGDYAIQSSLPAVPHTRHHTGWNLIYCAHVIEHMPTWRDAYLSLTNMVHALDPTNGYLVLAAPDYNSWGQDFWDVDYSHGYPFTHRRIEKMSEDCGLRILHSTVTCYSVMGLAARALHALYRPVRPMARLWLPTRRIGCIFNLSLLYVLTRGGER